MRAGTPNTIAFLRRRRAELKARTLALSAGVFLALATPVLAQGEQTPSRREGRSYFSVLRGEERRPASELLLREEAQQPRERAAAEQRRPPERLPGAPLDRLIDREQYRLGPGDMLILGLWGETNDAFTLTVTPEGDLIVPAVGPVHVAGLSLTEAQQRIAEVGSRAYQNVRLTLNLIQLRTFRVHVVGLVAQPGSYVATPADRASDAIAQAGGLAENASSRNILLTRADGSVVPVDLALFWATGKAEANPPVDMGDVLYVPAKGDSVGIFGAVGMPGYYEYRPGDSLSSLIALAGGLNEEADPARTEWWRFPVDTAAPTMRVVSLLQMLDGPQDSALRPGDRLFIPSLPEWRRRQAVKVTGEVRFPGVYSIVEGRTRLSDVLRRAGGPTARASLMHSRVIRRSVRAMSDPEFERFLMLQTNQMSEQEAAYLRMRFREVRGTVAVDLRRALEEPGGPDDVLLMDGDSIHVARRRMTVEVTGQVHHPGLFTYQSGRTVSFYLAQAGGLASHAHKRGIRVIRARTGVWIKPRGDTVLEPGDTIFVPEREPRFWTTFKDIVLVSSQLATTVLVIITLLRG